MSYSALIRLHILLRDKPIAKDKTKLMTALEPVPASTLRPAESNASAILMEPLIRYIFCRLMTLSGSAFPFMSLNMPSYA